MTTSEKRIQSGISDAHVRHQFIWAHGEQYHTSAGYEFDRWLADHDAQVLRTASSIQDPT